MELEPPRRERARPSPDQRPRGQEDQKPKRHQRAMQDDQPFNLLIRRVRALRDGAGRLRRETLSEIGARKVFGEVEREVAGVVVAGDGRGGVLVWSGGRECEDEMFLGVGASQQRAVGGELEGKGRRFRGSGLVVGVICED